MIISPNINNLKNHDSQCKVQKLILGVFENVVKIVSENCYFYTCKIAILLFFSYNCYMR